MMMMMMMMNHCKNVFACLAMEGRRVIRSFLLLYIPRQNTILDSCHKRHLKIMDEHRLCTHNNAKSVFQIPARYFDSVVAVKQ